MKRLSQHLKITARSIREEFNKILEHGYTPNCKILEYANDVEAAAKKLKDLSQK